MPLLVEVSNDRINWVTYERTRTKIDEYQWIRSTDYVDRTWSRVQVDGWLRTQSKNKDIRIEYSMDDGYSYQPFRLGHADDSARIFTIVQNHKYMVRGMTLTENNSYIPPADNSRAQAFLNAGYNPTGERKPRTQTIKRWVVAENGEYTIRKAPPYEPDNIVCMVEQHIPMTLKEPNVNNVTLGPAALLPDPCMRGHVYNLSACHTLTFNWRSVMQAHRKENIAPEDWAWVESARSYDTETASLTHPILALSVLSDKFYVDNTGKQFDKIGCRFLIPRTQTSLFIHRVNVNGGYAVWLDTISEPEQRQIAGSLENIMAVKEELKEAIASRNPELLAKKLFEVVEFRDHAIDELKELNIVLGEARKVAIELIDEESNGSPARSN